MVPAAKMVLVRVRPTPGQLWRFAVVGAASAAAYLLLYLVLRTVVGAQVANVVALVKIGRAHV